MRKTFGKSAESGTKRNEKVHGHTKNAVKLAVTVLALLLVISTALAIFEYSNALSLQNIISERDNALVERGKVITWLDTALNLTQLALNIKPPNGSRYLTTLPDSNHSEKPTKIYLVSTAVGYSYDPYPWPFTEELRNALVVPTDNGSISLPHFGWLRLPGNYSFSLAGGNPVLMVGVTVRNDYTPADGGNGAKFNSPIGTNPFTNRSSSWISLTVRFYNQNGDVVPAPDVNITQALTAIGGRKFALGSGETTQVVFYFSPLSHDVDHYEVYVSYLSANW